MAMAWLGKLIGTDTAVKSVLEPETGHLAQFGKWVGNLNYTEEEKAEGNKDTREWAIRQLEAMAPFKVVQRIIAFGVVGVWAFIIINLVAAIWIKAIWPQIDATTMLWQLLIADVVFWPVVSVLSLYFTGGVIKPGLFGGKTK